MSHISRNTVKKYIRIWNSLSMSYEEFQRKSDAELNRTFCVLERDLCSNPRMEELEEKLPSICKELSKRGMTTLKQ